MDFAANDFQKTTFSGGKWLGYCSWCIVIECVSPQRGTYVSLKNGCLLKLTSQSNIMMPRCMVLLWEAEINICCCCRWWVMHILFASLYFIKLYWKNEKWHRMYWSCLVPRASFTSYHVNHHLSIKIVLRSMCRIWILLWPRRWYKRRTGESVDYHSQFTIVKIFSDTDRALPINQHGERTEDYSLGSICCLGMFYLSDVV